MDADTNDPTLEELAELRYQEFLAREHWLMFELAWLELKYEIGKVILESPLGRFVYWLAAKLERYGAT